MHLLNWVNVICPISKWLSLRSKQKVLSMQRTTAPPVALNAIAPKHTELNGNLSFCIFLSSWGTERFSFLIGKHKKCNISAVFIITIYALCSLISAWFKTWSLAPNEPGRLFRDFVSWWRHSAHCLVTWKSVKLRFLTSSFFHIMNLKNMMYCSFVACQKRSVVWFGLKEFLWVSKAFLVFCKQKEIIWTFWIKEMIGITHTKQPSLWEGLLQTGQKGGCWPGSRKQSGSAWS